MFKKLNVPLIGIVENMHYVTCKSCSNKIEIFGDGTKKLAEELSCNILGKFPLSQEIASSTDKGTPIVIQDKEHEISKNYKNVAEQVVDFLNNIKKSL